MGQPVAFFEVISQDAPRAQKFYADLFGWQVTPNPEMGGYAAVDTGVGENAIGGGIGPAPGWGGEAGVKIYMRVDDLDGYLERAEKLGGKKLAPPKDLAPGQGRFAVFTDPDGCAVGLWAY